MATFVWKQTGPETFEVDVHGVKLTSALPATYGGPGGTPSPTEMLSLSLASCKALTAIFWAHRRGIPLSGIEVRVESEYASNPRRVRSIKTTFRGLREAMDDATLAQLQEAVDHCPVAETLRDTPAIETVFE